MIKKIALVVACALLNGAPLFAETKAQLFMPAQPAIVTPHVAGWFERIFRMQRPMPTAVIPTVSVGWLDLVGDIGKYEAILNPLSQYVEDPSIDVIIIRIDSEGGSPGDSQIIAEYIEAAKTYKPIIAFISKSACSAAYWIASSCSYSICPSSAEVGHIGAFMQMVFEKDKRYFIIGSGDLKAPTINENLEVKEEFLDYLKKLAYEIETIFAERVSNYRNIPLETVLSWRSAKFIGSTALTLGLVDQNGGIQAVFEKAVQLAGEKNNTCYEQLKLVDSERKVIKTYQL